MSCELINVFIYLFSKHSNKWSPVWPESRLLTIECKPNLRYPGSELNVELDYVMAYQLFLRFVSLQWKSSGVWLLGSLTVWPIVWLSVTAINILWVCTHFESPYVCRFVTLNEYKFDIKVTELKTHFSFTQFKWKCTDDSTPKT